MIIFGFFAEYIDGALGMAYGVTSSSLILTLGVTPAIASASVHTAEVATTLFAGISHWKFGNIRKDIAIPLIIPGVIGGVIGATLLSSVQAHLSKPVITVFLLLIGAIIFLRYLVKKQIVIADRPISKRGLSILGFVANKCQPRNVIGSVDSAEFFVTLAETITFMVMIGPESFHWLWVTALIIGGGIAAPVGAYTSKRIPARWLGVLVGLILVITNVRTILRTG